MARRSDDSTLLPEGFVPSEKDVICSWARQNHEHAGNKRFRELINKYSPQYMKATTKLDKTEVIAAVIDQVRNESSAGGGFVKKDFYSGRWYEIGDEKARDKVGHAMRKATELFNKEKHGGGVEKKPKEQVKSIKSIAKSKKRKQQLRDKIDEQKREPSTQSSTSVATLATQNASASHGRNLAYESGAQRQSNNSTNETSLGGLSGALRLDREDTALQRQSIVSGEGPEFASASSTLIGPDTSGRGGLSSNRLGSNVLPAVLPTVRPRETGFDRRQTMGGSLPLETGNASRGSLGAPMFGEGNNSVFHPSSIAGWQQDLLQAHQNSLLRLQSAPYGLPFQVGLNAAQTRPSTLETSLLAPDAAALMLQERLNALPLRYNSSSIPSLGGLYQDWSLGSGGANNLPTDNSELPDYSVPDEPRPSMGNNN